MVSDGPIVWHLCNSTKRKVLYRSQELTWESLLRSTRKRCNPDASPGAARADSLPTNITALGASTGTLHAVSVAMLGSSDALASYTYHAIRQYSVIDCSTFLKVCKAFNTFNPQFRAATRRFSSPSQIAPSIAISATDSNTAKCNQAPARNHCVGPYG